MYMMKSGNKSTSLLFGALLLLLSTVANASYIEKCLRNERPDRHCAQIQVNMERWTESINEAADKVGIDPLLLKAVVGIESHFNASAHSRSGPVGLVQIMPGTASKLGFSKEQLKNPELNLEAGATYLKIQEAQFHDNYLAVVAYNLGGRTSSPNKRAQHHAHAYAKEVMALYDYLQSQANEIPLN
jgi:soluble lytic murein transglycosylase-like protein